MLITHISHVDDDVPGENMFAMREGEGMPSGAEDEEGKEGGEVSRRQ